VYRSKFYIGFLLFFLPALFSATHTFAQESTNRVEDSLKALLKVATEDTVKMDLYNKLRRATYYSNSQISETYTARYLELAKKVGDSLQIAIANFYMGNANVVNGNPDKALPFYLKAANYFESKEDELSRLSSTYNGIASAYENNISDSLSLVYFEKSYETSKRANDHRRMGIALINRSNIHTKNGELQKAIQLLEEAVNLLQEPASAVYLRPAKINLAAAYAQNDELEKAETIYEALIVEIDSVKDVLNYAKALSNYGRLFQKKGESEKALDYLERAYAMFLTNGFMKERYGLMPFLIDAYYNVNKHSEAIHLFYDYNLIKDSIFSIEKDRNLTEALQKFEAEKKDKLLLEQHLQIEKKSRQKNLVLFGLIALSIFLIVGYLFFRKRLQYQKTIARQQEDLQKQKITELTQKNKLLAMSSMIEGQEAERLRIAKDLHDSLGGLLSNVKAHFTIIQKEAAQLEQLSITERTNHLIDEACLEVRRISHNMMPHALSISGLEGALEDVAGYMRSLKYQVTLDIHHLPETIETTKQITIYRLIQEILSNIRKHAEAKTVLIQLFGYENEIHLIIEDDGKGFNYDQALLKGGLGLKSINSRVEFLDGTIEWDSVENSGTTITINIPV
jgi:two-component system NarL family sensor kinase